MAQGWVSHHPYPHSQKQMLLRFGLVVLDCRQRRRRVGIKLPLAGAHWHCESEIGLKSGHNSRQVALSLNTWCTHLSAAKLAMAAWSK